MSINLSELTNSALTANALSNLILVTPQKQLGYRAQSPDNKTLEESFLFTYEGENTANLQSNVTDHFVENNTAIANHIALLPEMITVRGYIGELSNAVPQKLEPLREARNRLTVVAGYEPGLSIAALKAYNDAFMAYQIAKNIAKNSVNTWKSIQGEDTQSTIGAAGLETGSDKNQTKQQIAFQQFYGYWRERRLFTVQTPWAIFKNMAIMNLKSSQSEDNDLVSEFELQFKMIRFANTVTKTKSEEGRAAIQSFLETSKGNQRPAETLDAADVYNRTV